MFQFHRQCSQCKQIVCLAVCFAFLNRLPSGSAHIPPPRIFQHILPSIWLMLVFCQTCSKHAVLCFDRRISMVYSDHNFSDDCSSSLFQPVIYLGGVGVGEGGSKIAFPTCKRVHFPPGLFEIEKSPDFFGACIYLKKALLLQAAPSYSVSKSIMEKSTSRISSIEICSPPLRYRIRSTGSARRISPRTVMYRPPSFRSSGTK